MASVEISALLVAFVQLGIGFTSIPTSQTLAVTSPLPDTVQAGTTLPHTVQSGATLQDTVQAGTTLQDTVQAGSTTLGTATSHATTSTQTSTMSQTTTITRDATTSPTAKTSWITRTSKATTPPATTSSSATTSTRSLISTVSDVPVSYEPDPGNYELRLLLDLKIMLGYKQVYEDKTSPEFQSLATNISVSSDVSITAYVVNYCKEIEKLVKSHQNSCIRHVIYSGWTENSEQCKATQEKYIGDSGSCMILECGVNAFMTLKFSSCPTFCSKVRKLTEHYQNTQGFKSIEIIRFSPGSIIVEYYVNVYATLDIQTVTNQIASDVVDSLTVVSGVPVDINYTQTSMRSRLESLRTRDKCSLASANVCSFGYYCKPASKATILCIDLCNVSVCENNGLCYIGHLSDNVQCKCPISNGAAFTGEHCEIKQLVMTEQQRNLYLIIIGSIVVAVIFSFVLTVFIISRKGKHLKKRLSNIQRMNHDASRTTDIQYIRDANNRCVECSNKAINREQQHTFDGLPYQGGVNEDADDGYVKSVSGVQRREDPIYDYIM